MGGGGGLRERGGGERGGGEEGESGKRRLNAMLQTHMYTSPIHPHIHTPTHPSWVVMVTMYGKHRNRHIVVWVLVVHNWKPAMKTTD